MIQLSEPATSQGSSLTPSSEQIASADQELSEQPTIAEDG